LAVDKAWSSLKDHKNQFHYPSMPNCKLMLKLPSCKLMLKLS